MGARAVIYARCSTEEESQKDALIKQVQEGQEWVRKKGWILADSYVESRSGTTTRGRAEYNRLYEDLTEDKFEIIVIKSQDRLMRNTKDWYLFIDRMQKENKKLFIYLEQRFYSTDDALITGIKAILAEEYSRELSKKINLAHAGRQKTGGSLILTSNTYGYRKLPDGSVIIIEEEARVKRRMYELCAAGYGGRKIGQILKEEGIVNRKGNPFRDSDILRMIKSPLNKGTIVMHQRHYNFDTKKSEKIPEAEQFVYENRIPAIVSEQLWEAANQQIRARRISEKHCGKNPGYSCLSGKLICGICRKPFYRKVRRDKNGSLKARWICRTYLEQGKDRCNNITLEEERLCEYLLLPDRQQEIKALKRVEKLLEEEFAGQDPKEETQEEDCRKKEICRQMEILLDKLLEGVLSDSIYKKRQGILEEELTKLQAFKRQENENRIQKGDYEKRLKQIRDFLQDEKIGRQAGVEAYLEHVSALVVYPDHIRMEPSGSRIVYGDSFDYRRKKRNERREILKEMQQNPQITPAQIAEKFQLNLSAVYYRLKVLKKETGGVFPKTVNGIRMGTSSELIYGEEKDE